MRRIAFPILCATALAFAPGCRKLKEKAAEKAVERATGGQVDIDSKTGKVEVKQKGPDGKESRVQIGEGATIPADFPKAVPIYPGAKVLAAVSLSGGEAGHMVTLSTPDSRDTVVGFYKSKLADFKTEAELASGDTTLLTLSKDTLTVSIAASKNAEDDSTGLQLTTSTQKN